MNHTQVGGTLAACSELDSRGELDSQASRLDVDSFEAMLRRRGPDAFGQHYILLEECGSTIHVRWVH